MMPHSWDGVLLGTLALVVTLHSSTQVRRAEKPATEERVVAPINLRILPKNSSAAEIKDLMERYNDELGVSCDYCHTRNPTTQTLDYASDDNPTKQTARIMIAMLGEINTKYLAQLDDQKYAVLVSCGNCHRGQSDPPEFAPVPRALADSNSRGK
jgi:hypothetical protein